MAARWFRTVSLFAIVLVLVSGTTVTQAAPTVSPGAQPAEPLIARLQREVGSKARIAFHQRTGKVRSVITSPDRPIARAAGLAATSTPEQAARAFLTTYGPLFGIANQGQELGVMRVETLQDRSFVRFQQRYQGVPVLAGELVVQTNGQGDVLSASGEALPELTISVAPGVDAAAAEQAARSSIAQHYDLAAADLSVTTPALWVYNPALLGGPGAPLTLLVWRMDVRGEAQGIPFQELVLVNARKGEVALHFNQIAHAKERHVCNDNNVIDPDGDETNNCTPDKYVRSEGQNATGIEDVDLAYDYSGDTYDYFQSNFGRDSLDNAGLPLISLVKYCPNQFNCPYQNAFWDGQQMTYGEGYASADDVVGHELSHGFTDFSSDLFYYFQSGAINEAMSDIFGELIDLSNSDGNDSTNVRWLMGEELPGGAIRDMADPPNGGQPDRMNSEFYVTDESLSDNGGVHTNSGVANKSLYLLVDGDTFNGQTVDAIGAAKAGQIFYRANNNLLTSGSDYQDLASAMRAACASLVGSFGITAANCGEVEKAIVATEMDQVPQNAPAYEAPICDVGQTAAPLFVDNLENPASGNWASAPVRGSVNVWSYPQNSDLLNLFAGESYATSGKIHFFGADFNPTPVEGQFQNVASDSAIGMTKDVAIPANAVMHFRHAYDFGRLGPRRFSGGVVEYSTNGGASWQDAGALFTTNGYNSTVFSGFGNPLSNRPVFGGLSYGYTASRLSLASLEGQNVRFRFRIGTQQAISYIGWFIDDISIVSCAGTSTNSAPRATATGALTVVTGEQGATADVMTVSDVQDIAGTLNVSVTEAPAGLSIYLTNTYGIIRARVLGTCTATPGAYDVAVRVRDSAGLESTAAFTVNVEPAGQRIKDPSFEEGDPNFYWSATVLGQDGAYLCSTSACFVDPTTGPRTGNWWARFGSPVGIEATGSVSQTFSLTGNGATLEFYIKVGAHSGAGEQDYVKAYIDDTAVFTVTDATTTYDAPEFQKVTIDISNVGPGDHVLDFRERNVASALPFRVHIDDVRIINTPNACVGVFQRQFLPLPVVNG